MNEYKYGCGSNCGCDCDCNCGCSGAGGSLGELTVSSIPGLFETTVTSPSSNPTVYFELEEQNPYHVYARGLGIGQPSFQKLVPNHIPGLPASKIISGIFPPERLGSGTITPTSTLHGDGVWREVTFPPVDGFITTDTDQTGLTGNKTTAGTWTFSSLSGSGTRLAGLTSTGALQYINIGFLLSYDVGTNTLYVNIPSLKTFYVDGNNPSAGDGSILNPFNTLQAAIVKIIGTGTRTMPEFEGVSVKVSSFLYSFSGNLCINNVTWDFSEGSKINYTGTDYIVDAEVLTSMLFPFKIVGYPDIDIANGGFINNKGIALGAAINRNVYCEIGTLYSTTPLGAGPLTKPLVHLVKTVDGGGYNPPNIILSIKGAITSVHQTTFYVQGSARLNVSGTGNTSRVNFTEQSSASGSGNLVRFAGSFTDTLQRAYSGGITFKNIILAAGQNVNLAYIEGMCGNANGFYNVGFSASFGSSAVNTLVSFGNIIRTQYTALATFTDFSITSCTVDGAITITDPFQIKYVGTVTVPAQNKVLIYNCMLKEVNKIDPSLDYYHKSTVTNIVNAYLQIKGAPTYADNTAATTGGLEQGDVYISPTGELKIVI